MNFADISNPLIPKFELVAKWVCFVAVCVDCFVVVVVCLVVLNFFSFFLKVFFFH